MFNSVAIITMRGVALLVAALCLLGTGIVFAQGGAWSSKADMPTARGGLASSVVDGKIYVIGGYDPDFTTLSANDEYDPASDTWTSKAGMFSLRQSHCAATVNGKIYVIGGFDDAPLKTVEEYNPATNTWISRANMPTARTGLECSVVDGKIYAMGGTAVSGQNFTVLSVVEAYDPATNAWTARANMPIPREEFASGVMGGDIYVMGGFSTTSAPRAVHAYSPTTNTWTTKADMPTARITVGSATLNEAIFVIGGQPITGGTLATVEAFNPASNSWAAKTPMPGGRLDFAAAAVDGRIYAFGGVTANPPNVTFLSKVEAYDPNPTAVADNGTGVPASFVLHQNYPNPFNPATTIKFEVSKPGTVVLKVIDMLGSEVRTLVDEEKAPGIYETRWDGRDNGGRRVTSGVYLYRLESSELVQTRKMILMQ